MTTKMISFRAWSEVQDFLDDFCDLHGLNKSWVINKILANVTSCADEATMLDIVGARFPFEKGYSIRFEVDKDLARQRLSSVVTDL